MLDWIGGIATWLSQGINKIFLNGSPDMTVSARCHLNRDKPGWKRARRIINAVFFFQEDHCASSFQSDVRYAVRVLTAHGQNRAPEAE